VPCDDWQIAWVTDSATTTPGIGCNEMTDRDDFLNMNDEQVPGDAIADAPPLVAHVFRAAQAPAAAGETEGLDAMLVAFGVGAGPVAATTGATVVPIAAARSRRWVVVGSVVVAVAVSGVGVAAAGTGSLPAPLQRAVASVAERVGIDLPTPDDSSGQGNSGSAGRPSDGTTPSGVTPPGLNGQPDAGGPPVSTPSGVRPDDQQLTGWCTAWMQGNGKGSSMDAGSRQALTSAADERGTDVVSLCASLGVVSPTDTTVRPPNPNLPATPPGQDNGTQNNGNPQNNGNNGQGGQGDVQGSSSSTPSGNGNQGNPQNDNGNNGNTGNTPNGNATDQQGVQGNGQDASSSPGSGNGNQGNPQNNGNNGKKP
jgi:hypothetical protein